MHGQGELGSRVGATAVATGELEPPEIALCGIEGARSSRAMIVAVCRSLEGATGGETIPSASGWVVESSSRRVVVGKPHVLRAGCVCVCVCGAGSGRVDAAGLMAGRVCTRAPSTLGIGGGLHASGRTCTCTCLCLVMVVLVLEGRRCVSFWAWHVTAQHSTAPPHRTAPPGGDLACSVTATSTASGREARRGAGGGPCTSWCQTRRACHWP